MASNFLFANKNSYDRIIIEIKNQNFKNSSTLLKEQKSNSDEVLQLKLYNDIMGEYGIFKKTPIVKYIDLIKTKSDYAQTINYLNYGLYQLLYQYDKEKEALKYLKSALSLAEKQKNVVLKCEIYKSILLYYNSLINIDDSEYFFYLSEYNKNLYDDFEKINYKANEIYLKSFTDTILITDKDIDQLKNYSKIKKNTFLQGSIYRSLGLYYDLRKKDFSQASIYYQNGVNQFSKANHGMYINGKHACQICLAVAEYYNRKYSSAIHILKKIDTSYIGKNIIHKNIYKYKWLSNIYREKKQFDSAYHYFEKSHHLKNKLEQSKHNSEVLRISKQLSIAYKTKEKELENVNLKTNIKTNKIISFSSIGLLLVIIIVSILAYKNLSKKKKIIEQEKQLETQKLETTLKEQELHEIDVMLESQEKERQRIANELHDNLGSMLTTLKHNFENLKRNDTAATDKEKDLFLKTDSLIEEAYQEVRNIAHLKNLGVIGSEGLVTAVKKMAEKMSVLEKLHINVIPHGLNERLENSIEVMLFRMIQELCTNIIKHSEATEVNIYLTQHNNNELNIIIEDNGKGFDPKKTVSTSGIGLKSIEKKVEQMNGTFTIDSIVSKGTTIIIDLPI